MKSFYQFCEMLDELSSIYKPAHLAIKLVQQYEKATNRRLLHNITSIANLATDAYGHYDSSETEGIIRVNVNKIVEKFKGDFKKIILEIASTIIHECVHKTERQDTGNTSEGNAKSIEQHFLSWAKANWHTINR